MNPQNWVYFDKPAVSPIVTERWIPSSLRRVLVGEEHYFVSRLSVDECRERIASMLANPREYSVFGALTADGFVVKQNPSRRKAEPVAYGRFESTEDKTKVTILFALPKRFAWSWGLMLPIAAFLVIRSALQIFTEFGDQPTNTIIYLTTLMTVPIMIGIWHQMTNPHLIDEQLLSRLEQGLELSARTPARCTRDINEQWLKR